MDVDGALQLYRRRWPLRRPHDGRRGNLYGTTSEDGAYGYGNVFKLSPSNGGWTYTSLYDFTGGNDGKYPYSNVALDAKGNLYGTTNSGGTGSGCAAGGCGVVWEITP